jgi:integrase
VRVYAGVDPVTKDDLYLTEVVPVGPRQEKEAKKVRTRLLNLVDERRNPKTRATVDQLMKKYFDVLDVHVQTKRGYLSKYNIHIKPPLGATQLTRLDVETLDTFYSELRRCRIHCQGRKKDIEHRTIQPHQCDEHEGNRCPRNNPDGCRRCGTFRRRDDDAARLHSLVVRSRPARRRGDTDSSTAEASTNQVNGA